MAGLAPGALFEGLGFARLLFEIGIDLRLVCMVVSEGRVNLREGEVPDLSRDFLGDETHVAPLGDAADRHSGSGDAGSTAAKAGIAVDAGLHM